MFGAFFLALAGISYYGIRLAIENSMKRAYETDVAKRRQKQEEYKKNLGTDHYYTPDIKDYILSGDHYEGICQKFKRDFEFVFGSNWRDQLRIPPKPFVMDPAYRKYSVTCSMPDEHVTWVYHLMLADKGVVDTYTIVTGFPISPAYKPEERKICIRFAQCIERRLTEHGHRVRIVLQNKTRCSGESLMFEELCTHTYERLW